MAKSKAVWGIDIGQCALKALKCVVSDDGETVVAEKYDFIEYPKILSSADADPEELVQSALEEFLSRNEVKGDSVAISVPGQAGLSRFFKPPPVDAKTLPDIVKYEVKQQIPFPIEDVIWDWQQLGGSVIDGRTVDAEVGLFAMKRESVFRALRPFDDSDIEVDLIQLSPLSIFNVVCSDVLKDVPTPEEFDPENPPDSLVVMSMGTDTTDLIISNGIKLWMRNIPIGGNHFTKQLSRELKLTQAKAEHLKRNVRQAENQKAVFKAMRPVFNDLVQEVTRSLTFFQSMDKSAEISKLVLLGNAAKLPGLRQFLNNQLEIDIAKVSSFDNLTGAEVVEQKSFKDNVLSFAPSYGLCLQGLKRGKVNTNLLPEEIVTERVVRAKKPWVLASVGTLMLGCLLGFFFKGNARWQVHDEYTNNDVSWEQAKDRMSREQSQSRGFIDDDLAQKTKLDQLNALSAELVSASEGKAAWIEIMSAIYQALPPDEYIDGIREADPTSEDIAVDPKVYQFAGRKEIYIDYIDTVLVGDLNTEWYTEAGPVYESMFEDVASVGNVEAQARMKAAEGSTPLEGKQGWVIEIRGHHYHNTPELVRQQNSGTTYLVNTFLAELINGDVELPGDAGMEEFKFTDFGIYYPTIVQYRLKERDVITFNLVENANIRNNEGDEEDDEEGDANADGGPKSVTEVLDRFDFVIQMAWVPRSAEERASEKLARLTRMESGEDLPPLRPGAPGAEPAERRPRREAPPQ
ncbi:MAG: type IV pilus assembly protein PilM [Planctomycetota bacterium]